MRKNRWIKPKLIMMVRGEAGEMALTSCKYYGMPVGQGAAYNECVPAYEGQCFLECASYTGS